MLPSYRNKVSSPEMPSSTNRHHHHDHKDENDDSNHPRHAVVNPFAMLEAAVTQSSSSSLLRRRLDNNNTTIRQPPPPPPPPALDGPLRVSHHPTTHRTPRSVILNTVERTTLRNVRPKSSSLLSSTQPQASMKRQRRTSTTGAVTKSLLWNELQQRHQLNPTNQQFPAVEPERMWSSFRPRFVPPITDEQHPDAKDDCSKLEEDDDDSRDHDDANSTTPLPFRPPTTSEPPDTWSLERQSRHSEAHRPNIMDGPLGLRLQQLRRTRQADLVRCSFHQHHHRGSNATTMAPLAGPRNQTVVVDVTILGSTVVDNDENGKSDHHHQHLVTLPCYVHHWRDSSDRNATTPESTTTMIVLTHDTVQTQQLRSGSQLRIYDAIYIPPVAVDEIKDHPPGYIVCTQLCERYDATKRPALVVPAPFVLLKKSDE